MGKVNSYQKTLALLILFLMPIDYFSPTAHILREAGAKPLNIFILLCLFFNLLLSRKIYSNKLLKMDHINRYLLLILTLGLFAFLLNIAFYDYPASNRTPEFQFFSQFFMFALFILVFNALRLYFSRDELRQYLVATIPIVVFLHLVIFSMEFFGIFNIDNPGLILFFRNSAGLIDRASGLMSEPSYFGAFAGLFALPLIFFCQKYKIVNITLSLILVFISVLIQAKTFFIVIFIQILLLLAGNKQSLKRKFLILILAAPLLAMAIYTLNTTLVLNVDQNLSSANRLGSALLALNVASSGYGLLGIGFGQFHFFYLPEYSPNFLLLSQEALDQMNNVNDTRASTFSLPIRLLVETGILGLIAAVTFVYILFRKFSGSKDVATQTGLLFISGSVGFLLTQDTYCLPSLALGLALVTTQPKTDANKYYLKEMPI